VKILYIALFLLLPCQSFSQDSVITYTRILTATALKKEEIFDRALIWCSKAFKDSKSAIRVKERDGGIIAGKAYFESLYKVPKKKDSVISNVYSQYFFDWLIEIKENKLRFSIPLFTIKSSPTNEGDGIIVTQSIKPPYDILFMASKKVRMEWELAKKALVNNLNILLNSLDQELQKKSDDW